MVEKRCLSFSNQIARKAIYILLSIVSLKILSNRSQIFFKILRLPWGHFRPSVLPFAAEVLFIKSY